MLIVENKDTFFSLKALFQEGINRWNGKSFSMLIYGEGRKILYGEGRKILKSISFFEEIEEYKGLSTSFYYFGDLDAEGISI
ncbi:DUF2220 domain-containing protein [Peptococcaceae bacterium]|nr:DUF2220 domain-containing protein [Peptococcaceae bacterium]